MGESRTELVAWVNSVCGTEYQKVEQCGTGAAYCLILDSIFGNIPVNRVKLQAKQEYEYISNYKVLQNGFKANAIDKPIPVDRLIKCKMQDNLEFLQWYKKFWDQNYHGDGIYSGAGSVASGSHQASAPRARAAPAPRAARPVGATPRTASTARTASAAGVPRAQFDQVQAQLDELTNHCEGLEKERDFYFDKLRNIEVIVQARLALESLTDEEKDVLGKCQEILYSTVEGFEVPDPNQLALEEDDPDSLANGEWPPKHEHDEEETF